jgi:hypothetical protein
MNTKSPIIKRLKEAVAKAVARASAAKDDLRSAKGRLKQARKLFKAEKKAAKQARRKLDAAVATAAARTPRPAATLKLKPAVRRSSAAKPLPVRKATAPKEASPKAAAKSPSKRTEPKKPASKRAAPNKASRTPKPGAVKKPNAMRSAAEVAKSVIERLHAPPPTLPQAIPAAIVPDRDDSPGSAPANT